MLLVNRMRKQSAFIGHIMRRGGLEHIISLWETWKNEEAGGGTQKEQMMANLATRMNLEMTTSVISATWDEGVWKRMVDKALEAGHLIVTIMVQKQSLMK